MNEVAQVVKELGAVGVLAFLAIYIVVRLEPCIRELTGILKATQASSADQKETIELNTAISKEVLILLRAKNGKKAEVRHAD